MEHNNVQLNMKVRNPITWCRRCRIYPMVQHSRRSPPNMLEKTSTLPPSTVDQDTPTHNLSPRPTIRNLHTHRARARVVSDLQGNKEHVRSKDRCPLFEILEEAAQQSTMTTRQKSEHRLHHHWGVKRLCQHPSHIHFQQQVPCTTSTIPLWSKCEWPTLTIVPCR